jgi:hypothetical protein
MKERYSISIDEDSIKAIASISAQTGLTKSFIVSKWITEGLKNDMRLSISERYFFSKKILEERIDLLFSAIGYQSRTKDIHNGIILLFIVPKLCFQSEKEYELFRLSTYQILDAIQLHDLDLYNHIWDSLKSLHQNTCKSSESSEENINSETSLLPAGGTGMII